MKQVDAPHIAHLTHSAPWLPGSFNRLVGAQMRGLSEFRQVAISYGTRDGAANSDLAERVISIDRQGLSLRRKLSLRLPERLRSTFFDGIGGQESLIYAWQLANVLPQLQPQIVVCHDGYKLGPILRTVIDWPCRLILCQHGLSYHLPAAAASRIYSVNSFDVIWALTRASYHTDRERVVSYEPLVEVLPNGVDTNRFSPVSERVRSALRQKWSLPQNRPVVLMLGRLVAKKGVHVVLSSWRKILERVPDAFLWIVGSGDGQYERYVKSLAAALGDAQSSVRFEGAVAPDATPECYQSSDLYLFPTLHSEGMALSLFEAMACGIPCVSSEYEAGRELLSPNDAFFVSDPNVIDAFVEPCVRLLTDSGLRQTLASRGRTSVREHFGQDQWLARLRAFYRRQLEVLGAPVPSTESTDVSLESTLIA